MRIDPGAAAPEFEAQTWKGEPVRLADYRGKKLWLAFFRYASCPLCNLRVRDIIKRHDALAGAGLAVLGVVQSPAESVAEYMGKQSPPFPLLVDPDEKLYRLYGLESSVGAWVSPANLGRFAEAARAGFLPGKMEGTRTRIPGDFLLDAQGRVADAYYGDVIADHIPFERVERFARG